jgi:hypothetical protein
VFVLDFDRDFASLVAAAPWALIACASFEERCVAVGRRTKSAGPARALLVHPIDAGDHPEWARECKRKQAAYRTELESNLTPFEVVDIDLFDPDIVDVCVDVCARMANEMLNLGIATLVLDMSSMPKVLLFPLISAALDNTSIHNLHVTYAEPQSYSTGPLQADPDLPASPMPGFNWLEAGKLLAWIPLLGFGSYFTGHIYEALGEAGRLDRRVFPLVGFPGFEPHFFDRMISESGRRLVTSWSDTGDRFLYAPAWDPFATQDVVLRAISDLAAGDVAWVGSPLGPRPMALGMMLAAREKQMTLMNCQARSYHPAYSSGIRRIHLYPLKGG